uniref:Uncharacterized protein n=1 Tax=Macrostomum lignano TaxID=282301 RepID=A0A1I8IQP0_9PLAT
MFSTLARGRRYPGINRAHRHKNVTFGKGCLSGVAKGTRDDCLHDRCWAWAPPLLLPTASPARSIMAAGNWCGKSADIAYTAGMSCCWGRRGQRGCHSRRKLPDRLTREDILIWLENCDDAEF